MLKEKAIEIIVSSAKLYEKNLNNRNLLIVYKVKDNVFEHIEVSFYNRNYFHLTGVNIIGNKMTSTNFYQKCLHSQLSPSNIEFKKDGTTELKLSVLSKIMSISKISNMIGEYNGIKTTLITGKLCGTQSVCMGFVKDKNYYVPNTVLNGDMRGYMTKPHQIVAIFSKSKIEEKYTLCERTAHKFELDNLYVHESIKALLKLPITFVK